MTGSTIKTRRCPSCQADVRRFALSGLYQPVEQWRMEGYAYALEKEVWPVVPFSNISLSEWMLLCFRSLCRGCGLVSLWVLDETELQAIITKSKSDDPEGYAIDWIYSPTYLSEALKKVEGNAVLTENLESLLAQLRTD